MARAWEPIPLERTGTLTESNQMVARLLRPRPLAVLRVMARPRQAVRLALALADENASLGRQLDAAIRATVVTLHDLGVRLARRAPPFAGRTT